MLNRYGNKKRKIVVLGDMLELGKDEKEIHVLAPRARISRSAFLQQFL